MEDFTTYTVEDPGATLDVTTNQIYATISKYDHVYAYRPLVNPLTDFRHLLESEFLYLPDNWAMCYIWGASNGVGDYVTWTDGLWVRAMCGSVTDQPRLQIGEKGVGASDYIYPGFGPHYMAVERVGSVFALETYSNAARTDLLNRWEFACTETPYQNVYGFSSHYTDQPAYMEITVSNLDLGAAQYPQVSIAIQASDNVQLAEVRLLVDGALAYFWNPGTATFSETVQAELNPGTHTFRVEADDPSGNTSFDEQELEGVV